MPQSFLNVPGRPRHGAKMIAAMSDATVPKNLRRGPEGVRRGSLRDHEKRRRWRRKSAPSAAGLTRPREPAPRGVNFFTVPFDYLLMTRVLLAEDDTSISEPLSRALRREGYEVDVTADGPTTLDRALGEGVDLILLDIGLPELDGLEVCRRVRAGGYAVPVLILTARADEVDTVVGLDAGADD